MVLNKRHLRSIRANLPFHISATMLTMVTLLLFYIFYIAGTGIGAYGDRFFSDNKLEDATLSTYMPMSEKDISEIEKKYDLTLEKERYINVKEDGYKARVFVPGSKVDTYEVIKGKDISSDDEILISAGYAEENHVRVGDKIKLSGKKYEVCGMFLRPDYLYMLENMTDDYKNVTDFFLAYMDKDEFQRQFGGGNCSYKVIYSDDTDINAFRKYVDKHYFVSNYLPADENMRITFVHEQADMFITGSWIILVVFPFITVALISIIIGRKIKSEQKLIGTLSAMGYERGSLMRHYSLMAVIPGVLGGILTAVFSLILAKPFGMLGLADYEPMQVEFHLPVWVAVSGVVIPTLIYWCFGMLRVRKLLKRDTVELLNGTAGNTGSGRRIFVGSRMKVKNKFAVRTLLGSRGRTLVIFLGIFLGAMIIAFAFSFLDSVKAVGDQAHGEFGSFKYEYVLDKVKTGTPEEGEAMIMMPYENSKGERISLTGLDQDSRLWNLETVDGKRADLDGRWYMSSLAMELFNVKKGDTFTFRNIATLEKHKVKVAGEIKNGYQAYLLSSRENVNKIADIDAKSYNAILAGKDLDISDDELTETISSKTYENQMQNMLNAMSGMIYALMLIGLLICMAAMFVTINMMISEYRYTISMLKVLGFEDRKINSMIINANHLLLIPGIALGVVCAYLIMYWYCAEFVEIERLMIPVSLTPVSILLTALITAAGYFAALFLARRKVAGTDMVEALKDNRE